MNITEPIALVNEKRNIGVIMPCVYDKQRDESADYLVTRTAYLAAVNGEKLVTAPVIALPVVEDSPDETFDKSTEAANETISIEDLQAQLTALLAQCA